MGGTQSSRSDVDMTVPQHAWACQFCAMDIVPPPHLEAKGLDHFADDGGGREKHMPGTGKPPAPAAKSPPPPKQHSLKVRIKIADVIEVVEDHGKRKYDGLFKTMPKDLSKRMIDEVRDRLAFITSEGYQLSVEFGEFSKAELKIPGNIQVWPVDQMDENVRPGEIMKNFYDYKRASQVQANKDFTDVTKPGPGQEEHIALGQTPTDTSGGGPSTWRPIFVKIPQVFSRDELDQFKQGKKEGAELGIDDIGKTVSHEIGHMLVAETDAGHVKGNIEGGDQSFPPKLMDRKSGAGSWAKDGDEPVVKFATEKDFHMEKTDVDKLGGWPSVWDDLILPNVGLTRSFAEQKSRLMAG